MKCDSCGDEIGNLGGDWVALGKTGDICTDCASQEIFQLRERVRELDRLSGMLVEFKKKVISSSCVGSIAGVNQAIIDLIKAEEQEGGGDGR